MKSLWKLITFLYVLYFSEQITLGSPCRNKRCTMPECDMQYGALSMCAPGDEPCPAVHDEVPEINICAKRGMRCCRSICNGTGTMCMPNGNPCPSGFKTVKGICPWAVDDQYQCCSPLAGIKVEETPKNHNS